MEKNKRLYPINEELFNQNVLPTIEGRYIWKGHPPKVSHYQPNMVIGMWYMTSSRGGARGGSVCARHCGRG
jgi:hypothetical protein